MDRFHNMTGTDECPHCDEGLVLVSIRPVGRAIVRIHGKLYSRKPVEGAIVDEYGPCPWCEQGFQAEFPKDRTGPWGRTGYWKGRPPVLQDRFELDPEPLPARENGLRAKLLSLRFAAVASGRTEALPDPAEYLDVPEAKERLSLLEARLAWHGEETT